MLSIYALTQATGHLAPAPEPAWGRAPGEVGLEDLLRQGNVVVTLSVLFRHDLGPLPAWFYELPYPDLALYFLLLMQGGRGLYLPANMGVYRVHAGGWFSSLSSQRRYHYGTRFLEAITPHLPPQYQDLMTHELRHHYYESLVLSLKEFQLGTATRSWLRLGTHRTATATHRPKSWPHGLLLTGLQYTGRLLYLLNEGRRAAMAA